MRVVFEVPDLVHFVSSRIRQNLAVHIIELDEARVAQRLALEQWESCGSILAADVLERRRAALERGKVVVLVHGDGDDGVVRLVEKQAANDLTRGDIEEAKPLV